VNRYGKGIVISESFDEKIRMFALDGGITLWGRGELEMQIGRAVLVERLQGIMKNRLLKKKVFFHHFKNRQKILNLKQVNLYLKR